MENLQNKNQSPNSGDIGIYFIERGIYDFQQAFAFPFRDEK